MSIDNKQAYYKPIQNEMEKLKQKFNSCINLESVSKEIANLPDGLIGLCETVKSDIVSIVKDYEKSVVSDVINKCITDFVDGFQKGYPALAHKVETILQNEFDEYILPDANLSGNDFTETKEC